MTSPPEVWLRGPLPGLHPYLQPVAHALLQVREDVEAVVAPLSDAQLWARPGDVASIGFHLLHLAGSVDRLLTYSRAEPLSPAQLAALAAERTVYSDRPGKATLMAGLASGVDQAIAYLRTVPPDCLFDAREVGRKRLPSTVLGLIVHAAEHAARHAGQIVTLGPIVRAQVE